MRANEQQAYAAVCPRNSASVAIVLTSWDSKDNQTKSLQTRRLPSPCWPLNRQSLLWCRFDVQTDHLGLGPANA